MIIIKSFIYIIMLNIKISIDIKKDWDGFTQPTPKIDETPSEVDGLNDMSIGDFK